MGIFFVLIISSIAGSIGWWLGSFFGIAIAISASMIASTLGYWYGQKWNREYFG